MSILSIDFRNILWGVKNYRTATKRSPVFTCRSDHLSKVAALLIPHFRQHVSPQNIDAQTLKWKSTNGQSVMLCLEANMVTRTLPSEMPSPSCVLTGLHRRCGGIGSDVSQMTIWAAGDRSIYIQSLIQFRSFWYICHIVRLVALSPLSRSRLDDALAAKDQFTGQVPTKRHTHRGNGLMARWWLSIRLCY